MIIELWAKSRQAIERAGALATENARRAGIAVYYRDDEAGGMVREMPDGTRQFVEFVDGQDAAVKGLRPRS